jgi:CRP/FNR family transcriptional regulator, anaerobic regulatory protein
MPQHEEWTGSCPTVAMLDEATRTALGAAARPLRARAGAWLYREGAPCEAYLILLSGRVRVQKTGANGREIVLYRVGPGETCIVTTACLMCGIDYDAEGVAETDISARVLPKAGFRDLLARSEMFRDFVFMTYGTRISSLLMRIEEVAFGRIDERLAARLLHCRDQKREIAATHQELAAELGTAREVVSRRLKEFERKGWIRTARGSIVLLDEQPLRALAGHDFDL